MFAEFVAYQQRETHALNSAGSLDPRQRDAVFTEFVAYLKRHSPRSATLLDVRQRESQFHFIKHEMDSLFELQRGGLQATQNLAHRFQTPVIRGRHDRTG